VDENARVCRFTGAKVVKQTRHFSDPPWKHQAFPLNARSRTASTGPWRPSRRHASEKMNSRRDYWIST
jgi:hypothetical protein